MAGDLLQYKEVQIIEVNNTITIVLLLCTAVINIFKTI